MDRVIRFFESKDGTLNLEVDGLTYYSKYNPIRDVQTFLSPYLLKSKGRYILFGLGLGYHAKYLLDADDKDIVIVETDKLLLETLKRTHTVQDILETKRITIVGDLKYLHLTESDQIIIIPAWHKTLRDERLRNTLQDIIWLRTDEKSNQLLHYNFDVNMQKPFMPISKIKNVFIGDTGVLVSAGPSLEKEISFLKRLKGKVCILAVGSAYKVLLKEGVLPDAIVISDPNPTVYKQVENQEISVPLFVASTVYPKVMEMNTPVTYMAFQRNFSKSEDFAKKHHLDLMEVGGSVATLAFSLLIYMGIKRVIFVGQDLAYGSIQSHAFGSSSNQNFLREIHTQYYVQSNRGGMVPTSLSWNRFRAFFEKQIKTCIDVEFINTSIDGAVIQGAKYSNSAEISFDQTVQKDFTNILILSSI